VHYNNPVCISLSVSYINVLQCNAVVLLCSPEFTTQVWYKCVCARIIRKLGDRALYANLLSPVADINVLLASKTFVLQYCKIFVGADFDVPNIGN